MPFLRLTRDLRGYENTLLLHADQPGSRPRVLYVYRSAPGVRIGRPALDEDAIRTIEEQHPEIEFDWPHILEAGTLWPPEEERRPERPRRHPAQSLDETAGPPAETSVADAEVPPVPIEGDEGAEEAAELEAPRVNLLEQLVGREIATRLRARFAEVEIRIHAIADEAARSVWQARADRLNPDMWVTPEEVLRGVEHADQLFDQLRREIGAPHTGGA
ncbi:MAG: hypothetical protein ACT4QD_22790 [Acidobacteriota bacterium]